MEISIIKDITGAKGNSESVFFAFSVAHGRIMAVDKDGNFLDFNANSGTGSLSRFTELPPVTLVSTGDGNNLINHNLGLNIVGFFVKDNSGKFRNVEPNIIDSDNLNIFLSGGTITDAVITLLHI